MKAKRGTPRRLGRGLAPVACATVALAMLVAVAVVASDSPSFFRVPPSLDAARNLLSAGDYDLAEAVLAQLDSTEARALRAVLWGKRGKYDESRTLAEHVLAEAPDQLDALRALADACAGQGDWGGSARALRKLAEQQPMNAATWRALAVSAANAGDSEGALAAAHRALASEPGDIESANMIAALASDLNSKQRQPRGFDGAPHIPRAMNPTPRAPCPSDFSPGLETVRRYWEP